MKMTLKNRTLMALEALCLEAAKKGGIPNEITLSLDEGKDLLAEIVALRYIEQNVLGFPALAVKWKAVELRTEVPGDLNDHSHPYHIIKQYTTHVVGPQAPTQTIGVLLTMWQNRSIRVTYHYDLLVIPLIIDSDRPPSTEINKW